jgi:hypothetical protein
VTTWVEISTLPEVENLVLLLKTDPDVILTKLSQAVAKLSSYEEVNLAKNERIPDLHPGVWIRTDFDAFLPREFWDDNL